MSEVRITSISGIEAESCRYDIFIAALGFEARAASIATKIVEQCNKSYAVGFDHNQTSSYGKNLGVFKKLGFTVYEGISSTNFAGAIEGILNNTKYEFHRIAIDISCFDRQRLAAIIDSLWKSATASPCRVDFFYSIAAFRPPSKIFTRNEIAGPVHKSFAGRFTEPGRPLALIAGLGYEVGKVVGAAEYLQASKIVALFPISPISEYAPEVAKANELLLEDLPNGDVIRYPVDDCKKTIAILDSIINGLGDSYNIVMLPGGPKIFVLACLLAQRIHRQTSVWRVSSGSSITPRNIESSNNVVAVSIGLSAM